MKYDLRSAHEFMEKYLKTNIDIEYIAYESISLSLVN